MNNINNIIAVINENGGTASLEYIFNSYINKWHILPIPENKQKIQSTLIKHKGKDVFYDSEADNWYIQIDNIRNSFNATVDFLSQRHNTKLAFDHINNPSSKSSSDICYDYLIGNNKVGDIYYFKGQRNEYIKIAINKGLLPNKLSDPKQPLPGFDELYIRETAPQVVFKFYSFNDVKASLELLCDALDKYFDNNHVAGNKDRIAFENLVDYLKTRFTVDFDFDHEKNPSGKYNNNAQYTFLIGKKKLGLAYYYHGSRDCFASFEMYSTLLDNSFINDIIANKDIAGFDKIDYQPNKKEPWIKFKFSDFDKVRDTVTVICDKLCK